MDFKCVRGHYVYYPNLNYNSNIIDLGANNGGFSVEILRHYKSKCYAIEPNEKLFHSISQEITEKLNVAVGKDDGIVKFFLSNNPEASSLIKDFETHWGNFSEVNVEQVSWKKMLAKLKLKDSIIEVLKIDIEGAELDIIETFDENDLKLINQITIEFHDWLNKDLHMRTVKAIKKLVSHGYICITSSPNHTWPVEALFITKRSLNFTFFQRIIFKFFNVVTFLKY